MRARYKATARRDFDQAIEYLLRHAPHVAADFADSVEQAIGELLDHPYSAQATDAERRAAKVHPQFSLRAVLFGPTEN